MKDEEFTEGNCLIAEFMGLTRREANATYGKAQYYKPDIKDGRKLGQFVNYFDSLDYHSSWSELMPVVEKINSLGFFCVINEWQCKISRYSDYSGIISYDSITDKDTKLIDVTYKAVIEFIKWYTNLKPDNK